MAIVMKAGDTGPAVRATLLDADGDAVDLVEATIRFIMATVTTPRSIVIDAAAANSQYGDGSNGTRGIVTYSWAPGDTATPGEYQAEFEVTYSDGTIQTFPTRDYLSVTVVNDLGGAA